MHDGAHGGFCQCIAQICLGGVGEVAFKNMAEHIACSIGHLVLRQGQKEGGIHNAEHGAQHHVLEAQFALGSLI